MPSASIPNPAAVAIGLRFFGPYSTPVGSTKNVGTPNTPVRRRVVLIDQPTLLPVREMWSDPVTGAYQFQRLSAGTYFVASFDHTGEYNGEIMTDVVLPTPGA